MKNKNSVVCPVCKRGRLFDAGSQEIKKSISIWPHHEGMFAKYDIQQPCPKCKKMLDIRINKSA